MEQERHWSVAAVPRELLTLLLEQLVAEREELVAAREEHARELEEKDKELKAARAKLQAQEMEATKNQDEQQQSESGTALDSVPCQPQGSLSIMLAAMTTWRLEQLRATLIKEFMELDYGGRILGVKEMGRLNEKPFHATCAAKLSPKAADKAAYKLYTTWEKLLKNPSWKPFKTVAVDGDCQEVIDVDDAMLQKLKGAWGEDTHNTVVSALLEMRDYKPWQQKPHL